MNNMGKKLAIQGREKRGNDVINILKMLGETDYSIDDMIRHFREHFNIKK